jgi:predicted HicB family RNase H-like nuclease
MAAKPRTSTAIRFEPDVYEALAAAAEERGLSVNRIVNEAVQDFLPRLIPVEEWRLTR